MKPIFETRSKWQRVRALGQWGLVLFSLLLGLGVAQADTTNFVGDFAEPLWTKQPQNGSVNFPSDAELVLAGPNLPTQDYPQSFDGITYNGALAGGLRVGGTVQFNYDYEAGGILDGDGEFKYTLPDGIVSAPYYIGQGQQDTGVQSFISPSLPAGTTFIFTLFTDTTQGKLGGTLTITDFQFHDIPEPSTGALLGSAVILLCAARWQRVRIQARGLRQASSAH